MSRAHAAVRRVHGVWREIGAADRVADLTRRLPPGARRHVEDAKLRVKLALGLTLVPVEELERCYRDAIRRLDLARSDDPGHYLEFGVYAGTSMLCMQRATEAEGVALQLVGFDSFAGLPEDAATEPGGVWSPGDFSSSLRLTRKHLDAGGADWSRITLVPGWYDETLTPGTAERVGIGRASIVMVDCDLYTSARAALEFCEPLIRDEAVILFDDWHSGGLAARNLGERRAFEELLAAHPELSAEELEPYGDTAAVFHVRRADGGASGMPGQ